MPKGNYMVMTIEKPENQDSTRDSSGRFIPGQSGNPLGRPPKNVSITSLIKEKLDTIDPKTGKTHAQLITDKIFQIAMSGNLAAAQEILIRTDGKVTERHELTGIMIHTTPEMLAAAQARLKISVNMTNQLLSNYIEHKLIGQGIESVECEEL